MDENLVKSAIKVIKENRNNFCMNLLQRNLKIGHIKCAKLIEVLENRGIIGPYDSRREQREILI